MTASELAKTLLITEVQVPVIVLEDVKTVFKGGSGELVLKKGAKLELSLREALPLIRKRVVELDADKLPSLQELNKLRWIESRELSDIQKLEPVFYIKARLSIVQLEKKDPKKAKSVESILIDIVRLRLQKILKAVTANPEYNREFAEKLSLEEKTLYTSLSMFVKNWYMSMLEFIEKGDPLD